MSEKLLTIVIPVKDSEALLDKCLESFIYEDGLLDERLQLIIADYGSSDNTLAAANEWAERFPESILVSGPLSGGHGSAINTGLKAAEGKYFKVADPDGRAITANLVSVLDELEDTDTDVVVTGYNLINMQGNSTPFGTGQQPMPTEEQIKQFGPGYATLGCFGFKEVTLEELLQNSRNVPAAQNFQGLMYNTEFLKDIGVKFSENIFFEVQEYALKPFAQVESLRIMPYFLYEFNTETNNDEEVFSKYAEHSDDFLKMVESISEYHKSVGFFQWANEEFFDWRLSNIGLSYYSTLLITGTDKEMGIRLADEFRTHFLEWEPEAAERCEKKYKNMSKVAGSKLTGKLYEGLFKLKKR